MKHHVFWRIALLLLSECSLCLGAERWGSCGPAFLAQSLVCREKYTTFHYTEAGNTVWLQLPYTRPGELISSRIFVKWDDEEQKGNPFHADQLARLEDGMLIWGENKAVVRDGIVVWRVPFGAEEWFKYMYGIPMKPARAGGLEIPISSSIQNYAPKRLLRPMNDGEHFMSPVEATEAPVEISGPFNGDLRQTSVRVGSQDAEIIAESQSGLIFKTPKGIEGPQVITLIEGAQTAVGSVRFVTVRLSDNSNLGVEIGGLSSIGSPIRMLISTCSFPYMTPAFSVQSGIAAGRFRECRPRDAGEPKAKSQRRQLSIEPTAVSPGGLWSTNLTLSFIRRSQIPFLDSLIAGDAGDPPIVIDFAPLFETQATKQIIGSTIESWQRGTGIRLPDATVQKVRSDFIGYLPRLQEWAVAYDGLFYRADDFIASIVRLYLYTARDRSGARQVGLRAANTSTVVGRFLMQQSRDPRKDGALYSVAKFMSDLRDHYLLKIGFIEFKSDPPRVFMNIREGGSSLGQTDDEIGFTVGKHRVLVGEGDEACPFVLDIIEGPSTTPFICRSTRPK